MTWKIGIDTGGTFTDIVAISGESGSLCFHKVHSSPEDPGEAVIHGIQELCSRNEIKVDQIETIIHGSTVATNAVLEHKGARTAFITTKGFRDVLIIQRQGRSRLYDLKCERAAPLLPRSAIFEIDERILGSGDVERPLKEQDFEPIVQALRDGGFESIAVGFLNSYLNPEHELQAAQILRGQLPGLTLCLSHQVVGSQGEYERFSTCTINSYVQPKMQGYLNLLKEKLKTKEIRSNLFIMKSNGGMTVPEIAGERSAETLLSGPSGGVIASLHFSGRSQRMNLITADVGGTSFDVSVIHQGQPSYSSHSEINGLAINLPMIDIHTVGAGGGSIAWIDAGGALRVGPHSAGAYPGPACYGNGGGQPTVTDANLVLGRIAAKSNLAGGMELDIEASRKAIHGHLASSLNLSIEEIAEGIIQVVNARMTATIRKLTVGKGHDPEDFALCMFGGTGPLHGAELAEEMGVPEVIVPTMPGVFSAFGLLISDMRDEQIQTWLKALPQTRMAELETAFNRLAEEAGSRLKTARSKNPSFQVTRRLQLRYHGQSHMIPVDLPDGSTSRETITHLFEQEHRQRYGYAFNDEPIEIVNLWVVVTIKPDAFTAPTYRPSGNSEQSGVRHVFIDGKSWETPIYDRFALAPAHELKGPAIVEQPDTTTLILPGQLARTDDQGNLILKSRVNSNPSGQSAS